MVSGWPQHSVSSRVGPRQRDYLIPPVGGTERKLADGYFYGSIHRSPDARFIAVANRKSPNEPPSLYRIAAENDEELRLTTPPTASSADTNPVFSPDGRTLLFTRCGGTYTCGLYLLDLSAGYQPRAEPRLLRREAGPISGTAWTPDGRKVVYAFSSAGDKWSLHLMRVPLDDAAPSERLTYAGDSVSEPAIASRGDRLAYTQNSTDVDIWQVQLGNPSRSFASSTRIEFSPVFAGWEARSLFVEPFRPNGGLGLERGRRQSCTAHEFCRA
jgi:Tol biopolymer transport system component